MKDLKTLNRDHEKVTIQGLKFLKAKFVLVNKHYISIYLSLL